MGILSKEKNRVMVVMISIALLTLSIYGYCQQRSAYAFYSYDSPDGKESITVVQHNPILGSHEIFFVYGRDYQTAVPHAYVKPIYSGRDGGFVLLINWSDTGCTLVAPFGSFDTVNLDSRLKFKIQHPYSKKWKQLRADTLKGNNVLVTDYLIGRKKSVTI